MSAVTFLIFLLFSVSFSIGASPSVSSIFPPQYSHFFDVSSSSKIWLTESVLNGSQTQQKFGISLWIKIYEIVSGGPIFQILLPQQDDSILTSNFVSLFYISDLKLFTLQWFDSDSLHFPLLKLPYTMSSNWIFIGISAGFENKSCLLYYNDLGNESFISGFFNLEISIKVGSLLVIGKDGYIWKRIGDFRIHNNIYNDVADWRQQYLSSCAVGSCASLFPSIDYGKCDQWCVSQTEKFFPLFEPDLYSDAPYLTISDEVFRFNTSSSAYYDINPPLSNDYSITGWFKFDSCLAGSSTFFVIWNEKKLNIEVELALSTTSFDCDTLEAKIHSTDGTNDACDTASIVSSSYTLSWFFFAITLNSGSKIFKLYSQDGINQPSALSPLLLSPIAYTYTASPFNSYYMHMYIGGFNQKIAPGYFADFRFYYNDYIDTTLLQYNNNLFNPATYLEPHCLLWESIWYCYICDIGYFIKPNGLCQKCHYSCADCYSDETETNCLGCASGYYAQPGHPNLCLDYCPLGYTSDSSLNQCIGTPGEIISINFDDNLLGNFNTSTFRVRFGVKDTYYPDFDFLDPYPVNKRGMYFKDILYVIIDRIPNTEIFLSTDFTIEIWALPFSDNGDIFSAKTEESISKIFEGKLYTDNSLILLIKIYLEEKSLKFGIATKENNLVSLDLSPTNKNAIEWELYSCSLSFDNLSKTSQVLILRNKNYKKETIATYYKEVPTVTYNIGNGIYGGLGMQGFVYSFAAYNYGKSYSEIISGLGSCSSCSACPAVLNSCLPTCDKTKYVDEDGNCQSCLSSCSGTCSRADSCNLCYDDLCHKCNKYEIGACIQCKAYATLINGKCKCQNGYIEQDYECVNACEDEFYYDTNTQKCLRCLINCLKCNNGDSCSICKSEFTKNDGKCSCMDGYFIDSSNKCLKCNSSCLTCSVISSNCTSCTESLPILYNSNKCYPCDSFEGYSSYFAIPISYFTDDLFWKLSKSCVEICGDGRNMGQAQCDDGNNNNGDGCSSDCVVETGWSCFGGTTNSPDACKDIAHPWPILAYLSENKSGYLLALSFSEPVAFTSELSKNVEIEIENALRFSWSITKASSTYIITLTMHENVSAGTNVKIAFKNPSSIADMSGNKMKMNSTSTDLLESFIFTIGQAIKSSVTTATTVTVAGSAAGFLLGSFNFQALWSMVEIMQTQNYLIFLSPKYPDNLVSYLEALGIANGNILPNPFQLYLLKSDPFPDPPQKFIEQDYNTDFLMNSGQFILVWVIILAGLPISLLLYRFWPRLSIIRTLKNSYIFSVLLRTGIESFLEISLSVLLQLREFSQPSQDIGYLSLALCILTTIYLALTFALIIWQVTLQYKGTLNMKMHERKFGTLYEGFQRDSKLKVSFLIFQNLRRVLFVAICVFLFDYPIAQMALSVILSFTYTILLILLRPYEKLYLGNGLHISCEIFYFISHCLILKLLDDTTSDNYRTNLGWAVIALLAISLLLHIISILIVQVTNLIRGIKQFKEWFMKNFANKFAQARKRVILLNKIPVSDTNISTENVNESMAYFEGKLPKMQNKESIYTLRSTDVKTNDINTLSD